MPLEPLPESFAATRDALHRVAEEVVAPARKPHNEIALRQTPRGFGTAWFEFEGKRIRVRVDGTDLLHEVDDEARRTSISSIAEAGRFLGPRLLPDGLPEDSTPLDLDPRSAAGLADLYAFASEVLERFNSSLPAEAAASETNLWPEHFDIAFEAGPEPEGERATYGISPGDENHGHPYVYVGPWSAEVEGALWNATGFKGAELTYAELLAAEDQPAATLEFLRTRFEELAGDR